MWTLLSVIAILIAVAGWVVGFLDKNKEESEKILGWWRGMYSTVLLTCGLVGIGFTGAFFIADAGVGYYITLPWGGDRVVNTNGIAFKGWGNVTPINREIAVNAVVPQINENGELVFTAPESSDHNYYRRAVQREFNDGVKGWIGHSVVVNVDITNKEGFKALVKAVKTEQNLVKTRIYPMINAAEKNSAKLMGAQDYIAGKSSAFDQYFKDQLSTGTYKLKEVAQHQDSKTVNGKNGAADNKVGTDQSFKLKEFEPEEVGGNIIRNDEGLHVYGLEVTIANIGIIDWEPSFDKRLDEQKAIVAQIQSEKRLAEKALYTKEKEKNNGEAAKIKEQLLREKEMIQKTMAARTLAEKERWKVTQDSLTLVGAKYQRDARKTLADGKYYENQKLVAAGLTPQERAYWEFRSDSVAWANASRIKLPHNFASGGKDGKGGASELLILQMLQEQIKKQGLNK